MTPEHWRRISSLFHGALAQTPDLRKAFLDQACGADAGVRDEVERLLRAHQNAGAFGEMPLQPVAASAAPVDLALSPPPTLQTVVAAPAAKRRFVWIVWLLSAGALISFAYGLWLLIFSSAMSMGWEVQPRGSQWYVNDVRQPGPAAGQLQLNDRLISVNGVAPVPDAGLYFQLRTLAPGVPYEVVIERDGIRQTYLLRAQSATNTARIVWFAVSLTWCVVGLFVGFARPESVLARLGCLSALATGLVFLQIGVIHGGPLWQPLHVVLGFHFLARFPTGEPSRGMHRRALCLAYVTGALPAVLGLILSGSLRIAGAERTIELLHEFAPLFALRRPTALVSFAVSMLGMLWVVPSNYRRLKDEDQRRRVRWVVYAALVAFAPLLWWAIVTAIEIFVGPPGLSRFDLLANGLTVVIPIAMAYAVLKHRVLDIRVAIRRGVQYLLAQRALQVATDNGCFSAEPWAPPPLLAAERGAIVGSVDPEVRNMSLESLIIWIVVGLIAGWLASAVVGGAYGLVGDIVVGVVGAFVGGWLFRALHIAVPFGGLPGTIFVAFIGAVVLLVLLRLISRARTD